MNCYLSTGANKGNRAEALGEARRQISARAGHLTAVSPIYETAAWGLEEQPAFLNQVLALQTDLHPEELLQTLLQIERDMGRERRLRWGPRLIDIDILSIDDLVWNSPSLSLPHPHLQDRNFVLYPLAVLCPDWEHPLLQKDVGTLLAECKDPLPANLWQRGDVSGEESAHSTSD